MNEKLIELILNNLTEAKTVISEVVEFTIKNEFDITAIAFDTVDYHMQRISAELSAAYALYGNLQREEFLNKTALEKAQAQAYQQAAESEEKKKYKTSAETLKRLSLLNKDLLEGQKKYGEALCRRITQEGIIKALETKRDIIKSYSIKQHRILFTNNGEM